MVLEYLIFLALKVRALQGRRRKREEKKKEKKKEEEKKRRRRNPGLEVWNSCLKISYSCLELWFRTFVWICWLGNPPSSLFAYVWALKSLYKSDLC